MKIKFLESYQVKDCEGKIFRQGEVYDLPLASANHFLKRGKAISIIDCEIADWENEKILNGKSYLNRKGRKKRVRI